MIQQQVIAALFMVFLFIISPIILHMINFPKTGEIPIFFVFLGMVILFIGMVDVKLFILKR